MPRRPVLTVRGRGTADEQLNFVSESLARDYLSARQPASGGVEQVGPISQLARDVQDRLEKLSGRKATGLHQAFGHCKAEFAEADPKDRVAVSRRVHGLQAAYSELRHLGELGPQRWLAELDNFIARACKKRDVHASHDHCANGGNGSVSAGDAIGVTNGMEVDGKDGAGMKSRRRRRGRRACVETVESAAATVPAEPPTTFRQCLELGDDWADKAPKVGPRGQRVAPTVSASSCSRKLRGHGTGSRSPPPTRSLPQGPFALTDGVAAPVDSAAASSTSSAVAVPGENISFLDFRGCQRVYEVDQKASVVRVIRSLAHRAKRDYPLAYGDSSFDGQIGSASNQDWETKQWQILFATLKGQPNRFYSGKDLEVLREVSTVQSLPK